MKYKITTWMPSIPNMIKNVQQMRTTFPIGRSDDSNVITTNLRPGARLITLYTTKHHVTQGHIQKYKLGDRGTYIAQFIKNYWTYQKCFNYAKCLLHSTFYDCIAARAPLFDSFCFFVFKVFFDLYSVVYKCLLYYAW